MAEDPRPPMRPRRANDAQLPLALSHDPAVSRDDLIVSDPLTAAASIVDSWPKWPSPVVVITGPGGSGKSHLAAIWSTRAGAVRIRADEASAEAALAAASAGPVLIEDIDRAPFDEATLFHIINTVRAHGTSLMMTARLWPAAWPIRLPDLVSRLKAATVVEIGEPDDALLTQVIVKLFADRQIAIDPKVVSYLVQRMERSLDAAQRIVAALDRLALARRSRITRALAAEVLSAGDPTAATPERDAFDGEDGDDPGAA